MEARLRDFDEIAKEGIQYVLENFWVLREKQPELYQQIRSRESIIKGFFLDKMGLNLIVHRQFIKLEKFPVEPKPWMGMEGFLTTRDYVVFASFMAFLEGKSVDEQFLLSDLCEELKTIYPSHQELDWTHYEHRKSLVRVLQVAGELDLVKTVDGDISDFGFFESSEVLYEVPLVSRYFLRSFPKDLTGFNTINDFLEIDDLTSGEQIGVKRRQRVYRQLFLTPVAYSKGSNDPDFLYLRNFRNRIREDVEKYTDFRFELFRNTALLTVAEKRMLHTLFPDNRAISDIVLQFAKVVREEQAREDIPLQYDGSLCVTPVDFALWVDQCAKLYSSGWSKQYREATPKELVDDLLATLVDWQMAEVDEHTGVIALQPLLARTIGSYSADYLKKGEGDNEP
ncbi:MAG: TIGR02678 family protein [Bacillota bacterium]